MTAEASQDHTTPRPGERVEHRKGGAYEVVGAAKVQADTPLADYAEVVVYRSETDGGIWVRPVAEFLDGRFSPLPAVGSVEHFLGALATAQAYLAMNPVVPGARPLETAAQSLLASVSTTYRKRNGQIGSIEGDDGEMSYIVPFDAVETLRVAAASNTPAATHTDNANGAPEGVRRSRIALPSSADRRECCIACDEPLRNGDRYLPDADGGAIHYACCGPERESYTDSDGEPLRDDAPIPQPSVWVDERASATMQGAMERLGDECWSLVCKEYPTGGDDYDVGYEVISYHVARPTERLEGFGSTPRTALQSAGLLALSAETTVSRPSQVAQVEEAGPDVRLDSEKAEEWPAAKKALWHVVTDENLNDGHYINAYRLTEKLYAALATLTLPETAEAVPGASHPAPATGDWERLVEAEAVFRKIREYAENIAFSAGVGESEIAGQIVSFLVDRPELLRDFMAGALSAIDTGMLDHHNGVLSYWGMDGKVHRPDPRKARFPAAHDAHATEASR